MIQFISHFRVCEIAPLLRHTVGTHTRTRDVRACVCVVYFCRMYVAYEQFYGRCILMTTCITRMRHFFGQGQPVCSHAHCLVFLFQAAENLYLTLSLHQRSAMLRRRLIQPGEGWCCTRRPNTNNSRKELGSGYTPTPPASPPSLPEPPTPLALRIWDDKLWAIFSFILFALLNG